MTYVGGFSTTGTSSHSFYNVVPGGTPYSDGRCRLSSASTSAPSCAAGTHFGDDGHLCRSGHGVQPGKPGDPPRKLTRPLHGIATWYGAVLHGQHTASGKSVDNTSMTSAHRTLPLGSPQLQQALPQPPYRPVQCRRGGLGIPARRTVDRQLESCAAPNRARFRRAIASGSGGAGIWRLRSRDPGTPRGVRAGSPMQA